VPHIGLKLVQKLKPAGVEAWHTTLRTSGRKDGKGGLSTRTVKHAHRVLSQALRDAVRLEITFRNAAADQGAPRVEEEDPNRRRGSGARADRKAARPCRVSASDHRPVHRDAAWRTPRPPLAQRRSGHEDREGARGDRGNEKRAPGEAPKTKAGRRDISLPDIVVEALREHRRQQLELRVALGTGRMPEDALVFPAPLQGGYQRPRAFKGMGTGCRVHRDA
jgi:integrase